MTVLRALSYGDRRALVNAVRALRTQPGRVALWTVYALAIGGVLLMKTRPTAHPVGASTLTVTFADVVVCGAAFALGIVLLTGTARSIGVFSSRAEALMLARADVPAPAVALYVQLRAVLLTVARTAGRFAYLVLVVVPYGAKPLGLLAQLCFFSAAGAAIVSVALPRALARGAARAAAIAAGAVLLAASAYPVAVDLARLLPMHDAAAIARRLPSVHPGAVLTLLAAGDLRLLLPPLALAAFACSLFVRTARDAYPELYALSLAALDWRVRRGTERAVRARRAGGSARAPFGALAFVWADALTFARRVTPAVSAAAAALAIAAGAVLAAFARRDGALAFGILIGAGPGIAIAIASTTGVRIAPALRMPLFWLGSVPLIARLGAWTLGALWRDAALVALGAAGYAAVARDASVPLVAFIAASAVLALTRGVGLAVFALVPNQLDQRGPAVLLRTFACTVLLLPPIAAAVLAAFGTPSPFVAVLGGAAVAGAETALLLAFAAWRLSGRVDRLSLP